MKTMERGMNYSIIGLTGSFGSGCSYIGEHVLTTLGYESISLSKILRSEWKAENPDKNLENISKTEQRAELQAFGDSIRENRGPDYLAKEAIKKIEQNPKANWVIDSIRNPNEVWALRDYSNKFYLFGIAADTEVRWRRSQVNFDGNRKEFDSLDSNDSGKNSAPSGQRVADCFYESDIVFANNRDFDATGNDDFQALKGKIERYVTLTQQPLSSDQPLAKEEPLMAMAYAASQRSSCMKRKVGAVIVDHLGYVVASGFNEVPRQEKPCQSNYTKCYRDYLSEKFFRTLSEQFPEIKDKIPRVEKEFRKKFKILDYCRALHAEESAIVALARNSVNIDLKNCTLYTTTYPCRLCANKISETGIGKIVYLEPYPQPEAKLILQQAATQDKFFEGVTFRAYFRLYGEKK